MLNLDNLEKNLGRDDFRQRVAAAIGELVRACVEPEPTPDAGTPAVAVEDALPFIPGPMPDSHGGIAGEAVVEYIAAQVAKGKWQNALACLRDWYKCQCPRWDRREVESRACWLNALLIEHDGLLTRTWLPVAHTRYVSAANAMSALSLSIRTHLSAQGRFYREHCNTIDNCQGADQDIGATARRLEKARGSTRKAS